MTHNQPQPQHPPKPVDVFINRQELWLPTGVQDVVSPLLDDLCDSLQLESPDLLRPRIEWRELRSESEADDEAQVVVADDFLVVPLTLLPMSYEWLTEQGYQVAVLDLTSWEPLNRADVELVDHPALTPWESELLGAVAGSRGGQLVMPNQRDTVRTIALLGLLFPHERILVIARNKRHAHQLAEELRTITDQVVSVRGERHGDRAGIHVETLLTFNTNRWEGYSIIIFADVASARSESALQKVWVDMRNQCLVFALVPTCAPLDETDQLRLALCCGEEIYRLDNAPPDDTHVSVLQVGPASYPAGSPQDPLQRKRTFLWHNPHRNHLIAQVAQAIRSQDMDVLRKVAGDVSDLDVFLAAGEEAPSVVILVESPTHGRELRKLLPDWPLLCRTSTEPIPSIPEQPDEAIATQSRADEMELAVDVIIRAEGTGHPWRNAYGPHYFMNGDHMLVLDVVDDFDHRAERDTQQRVADYRMRGWEVRGRNAG